MSHKTLITHNTCHSCNCHMQHMQHMTLFTCHVMYETCLAQNRTLITHKTYHTCPSTYATHVTHDTYHTWYMSHKTLITDDTCYTQYMSHMTLVIHNKYHKWHLSHTIHVANVSCHRWHMSNWIHNIQHMSHWIHNIWHMSHWRHNIRHMSHPITDLSIPSHTEAYEAFVKDRSLRPGHVERLVFKEVIRHLAIMAERKVLSSCTVHVLYMYCICTVYVLYVYCMCTVHVLYVYYTCTVLYCPNVYLEGDTGGVRAGKPLPPVQVWTQLVEEVNLDEARNERIWGGGGFGFAGWLLGSLSGGSAWRSTSPLAAAAQPC